MLGAGTKTVTIPNSPQVRCLDLTRLISRVGRGALTGVDRVELAYLKHLLMRSDPFFVLVRTALGSVLLDRKGASVILDRLLGVCPWGKMDLIGRLNRKSHPLKRKAEADLRRLAIDRCRSSRIGSMLKRHFSGACTYFNVGHSNLTDKVLRAWRSIQSARIVVLVHDTIPLDFPQYQREGTVVAFERRMRRVAANADQIICISSETECRVRYWFSQWGQNVATKVAHLGVDVPVVALDALPSELHFNRPYFVSVGTIEPRKNHALLLDVWEAMGADAPILVIAGARGWKNDDVFQRLDANPANVIEASDLSDGALGALVARSSGLLYPTFAEGFGLPPAEALALNVPVICADLPVLREILGNMPIYAAPNDMYLWKQSIYRLTEQYRAGQAHRGGKNPLFVVPTWEEHFNLVLKDK